MRKNLLRVLGLASFIALLTAAGGYYAYAHSASPEPEYHELTAGAAGAWLGVVVAPSPDGSGVVVVKLMKDGPAAKAGVQARDIIKAIGTVSIATPTALRTEMQNHAPNQTITLKLRRGDADLDVPVALEAAPQKQPKADRSRPALGMFPFGGMMKGGFDSAVGGSFTRIEDNKKVVYTATFGKVTTATNEIVTVDPNGADDTAVSFTITSNTKLRGKGSDLKPGDKVVAITRDGELIALTVVREEQKNANRTEGNRGENKSRVQGFPSLEAFGAHPTLEAMERMPAIREMLESRMSDAMERFAFEFVY